jgi:hypothetical protein
MRVFKKAIIIILSIIFFFFILIAILTSIYSEEICKNAIKKLSTNINAKIEIANYKLSFLRSIPYATIILDNVEIGSAKDFKLLYYTKSIDQTKFLTAKQVVIKFNLIKLLKNEYKINQILVRDGLIQILENQKNKSNLNYSKLSMQTEAVSIFELKKIALINMAILYCKEEYHTLYNTYSENLSVSGTLNGKENSAKIEGELKYLTVFRENETINFKNKFLIQTKFRNKKNHLEIIDGYFNFKGLKLYFSGGCDLIKPYKYKMNFRTDKTTALVLNNFLPEKKLIFSNGHLTATGSLSGTLTYLDLSRFEVEMMLRGVAIEDSSKLSKFKNIDGLFKISNNDKHSYLFKIITLSGYWFNSSFNLNGNITYCDSINIDISISSNIEAVDLNKFLIRRGSDIKFANGSLQIKSSITGPVFIDKRYSKVIFRKVKYGYKVKLNDLCFEKMKNSKFFGNINGEMESINNGLLVKSISGNLNSNNFTFKGEISGLNIFYLDSLRDIGFIGNLKFKTLNFNTLLDKYKNATTKNAKRIWVSAALKTEVDTLIYKKIVAYNMGSNISFSDSELIISNITGSINNGILLNGYFKSSIHNNILDVSSGCFIKNIDLKDMLKSFENFGQDELTDKNILGNLSGNLNCSIRFDENGKLIRKNLSAIADIKIQNGELIDFKPVEKLSKFVDISELNDIKFAELKNVFLLENNIIYIPSMRINSSAINLSISGTHSLDNEYEYHFKVLLSDILFKKSKFRNKMGRNSEESSNKEKGFYVYVMIKGKGDKYNSTIDSKHAMEGFIGKMRNEKTELKAILSEEYGFFNKDSIKKEEESIMPGKKFYLESEEIKTKNRSKDKKARKAKRDSIEWDDK